MVKGLEDKRILRGDLILAYNFLSGCSGGGGVALLSLVTCGGPQGNRMRLHQEKLGLGTEKRFSIQRVVSHTLKQASQGVVTVPSVSEFSECLDNALSHMVYLWVVLQGSES